MTDLPPPTFDQLSTFSYSQLEALEVAWEWILKQPAWAPWHGIAKDFLRQIKAEMDSPVFKGDVDCPRCKATVPYVGGSRLCPQCGFEFDEVYIDDGYYYHHYWSDRNDWP